MTKRAVTAVAFGLVLFTLGAICFGAPLRYGSHSAHFTLKLLKCYYTSYSQSKWNTTFVHSFIFYTTTSQEVSGYGELGVFPFCLDGKYAREKPKEKPKASTFIMKPNSLA